MMILAATTEPQRGWGGPTALVGAVLVFWLFTYLYRRFVKPQAASSPTPPALPSGAGKPQLTAGVDPLTPAGDPYGAPAIEPPREPLALDWGYVDYADGPASVQVPTVDAEPAELTQQEPETLDDFVAEQLPAQRPADVIRLAKARFGKSEATVKRAIKRVREQAGEQA